MLQTPTFSVVSNRPRVLENREKYGQLSEDAGELISKYCRKKIKKYSDEEVIPMGSVSENFQKIFIRFLFVVKRTINN